MFYYKKEGGKNDSRQIAFFVGGKKGHSEADDDIQCGATEAPEQRTDKRRSHYSPILRMSF